MFIIHIVSNATHEKNGCINKAIRNGNDNQRRLTIVCWRGKKTEQEREKEKERERLSIECKGMCMLHTEFALWMVPSRVYSPPHTMLRALWMCVRARSPHMDGAADRCECVYDNSCSIERKEKSVRRKLKNRSDVLVSQCMGLFVSVSLNQFIQSHSTD